MALKEEIEKQVQSIFQSSWTVRPGRVVPAPKDVGLGNDAVAFDSATVLYADLSGSTRLVDAESRELAAEVYKSYLYAAARIINSEGGSVTAYDGDRIMALFLGGSKNTSAVRCALKINYAVTHIVNPALAKQYPAAAYRIKQVVGVDTSPIMAARTGARGDNDLVWVGRAANHAAKLTELSTGHPTWNWVGRRVDRCGRSGRGYHRLAGGYIGRIGGGQSLRFVRYPLLSRASFRLQRFR
jgi:class 3 adenylate cyclase